MLSRRWLSLAAGLLAFLTGAALAQSDDLPGEPMLRINAPSHIARIRHIATDAKERVAVTASDDKTVRVWSLPDGRLQRTIWLPSGNGKVGKAYAVALSPDGATIAVGGLGSIGVNNIYLFDRASGTLTRRLPSLPDAVNDLAFSPDGKRLAAAIHGTNGIRVYDTINGYRSLPSDSDYGDASYSVDIDRDGRLVSASLDGFVRLYAPDHYDKPVVPKTRVKGVGRPYSVAFSPDGRHVAVGDTDSSTVAILRDRDLTPQSFPTVGGFDDAQLTVAWSKDGQRLFAGGYNASSADPLDRRLARRWNAAGSGAFVDITGATDTVMQYVPLGGQRMLFADAVGFGLIDGAGKATRLQNNGSIDFRQAQANASDTILTSPDARTVQVGDWFSKHVLRFDLARRAVAVDPGQDSALSKPITESTRIKLTDWKASPSPKLNGATLVLEENELRRCPKTIASFREASARCCSSILDGMSLGSC